MKGFLVRRFVSGFLAVTMWATPIYPQSEPRAKLSAPVLEAFEQALAAPYLELFDEAAGYEFNSAQIQRMRDYLDEAEGDCVRGVLQTGQIAQKRARKGPKGAAPPAGIADRRGGLQTQPAQGS